MWYQEQLTAGGLMPTGIAYFSMEFGVAEVLPNYSGGLGILAGDHLKSASDLGLPLIAVGLHYRSGYFRQSLTADGWQRENVSVAGPAGSAAAAAHRRRLARRCWSSWPCPDRRVLRARVWIAQVGRIPLLLLDSDIPENDHELRGVTDRLYGGDQEHRIKQEILAGIGGVRAIRAFTAVEGLPDPEVFHMNEGHAGFLGVERIRELVTDGGLDFDTALAAVRSGTVFTTHTPVPAGHRPVSRSRWCGTTSAATTAPTRAAARMCRWTGFSRFGAEDDRRSSTWRTWGCGWRSAPTGCRSCTATSAARMFNELWQGFDAAEVPIGSITNGVHAPTWAAPQWVELGRELVGGGPEVAARAAGVGAPAAGRPGHLWWIRSQLRALLVDDVRRGCGGPGSNAAPRRPKSAGSQTLSTRTC